MSLLASFIFSHSIRLSSFLIKTILASEEIRNYIPDLISTLNCKTLVSLSYHNQRYAHSLQCHSALPLKYIDLAIFLFFLSSRSFSQASGTTSQQSIMYERVHAYAEYTSYLSLLQEGVSCFWTQSPKNLLLHPRKSEHFLHLLFQYYKLYTIQL